MEIDPASFWPNLFYISMNKNRCHYKFLLKKIKEKHFLSTKPYIDCLCTINDAGEFGYIFVYL